MNKQHEIAARENELWDDDRAKAEAIIDWFDLLIKLRNAAGAGVDAKPLVEQLMRADPDQMHDSYLWMIDFLFDRFELRKKALDTRKQNRDNAAARPCKYTRAQWDAAEKAATHPQTGRVDKQAMAKALNVDRKTMKAHGRPPM
jgi:hypothetical protein